uniref:Uncharacterized protein n=1 Tax=Anopheles merus TaxID=30066 RepID=A0A182UX31_ANOME
MFSKELLEEGDFMLSQILHVNQRWQHCNLPRVDFSIQTVGLIKQNAANIHTNKVDIVTSSPVLAKRDSEVNKDIYELFEVSVHHNCSEDLEQRKETYSNYQVVYGDLASFQRDYLLDRFYGKNILGDRDFSCVIVDEVDSMLVDKGNNMLYLSHDIPGMDKLESVYVFIWQAINSSPGDPEDIDTDEIKDTIMNNLYDRISFNDLKKLDPSLSTKKLYKLLYGLTGTLGSQGERHLLKEVHQVDFVTIPPTKSKQFDEYDPIICLGHNKWLESIRADVDTLVNEQHRSVLIICDTINDVQSVEKCLKAKGELHVSTYTRDFEEFDVVQGTAKLQQGEIIIATNLAGRGTDIRISDKVREAGGLHVILTYLPENIRIEEQAFGRAARSGDKGSGRMILMVRGRKQFRRSKIIDLKKKRDKNELYRISEVKSYYEKHIVTEENCFKKFKKVYEKHREALDNADVPREVKAILLESCLDQWAFWLDEHSGLMEEFSHECDEKRTPPVLKTFLNKLQSFQSGECTGRGINMRNNGT